MARVEEVEALKTSMRDHPDVTDDERMRAVALAWLVRGAFLGTAVAAFPAAFVVAAALMMKIDGSQRVGTACAFLGVLMSLSGTMLVRAVGLFLESKDLRRVLKRSAAREQRRLGASGAATSIAVPTFDPELRERP